MSDLIRDILQEVRRHTDFVSGEIIVEHTSHDQQPEDTYRVGHRDCDVHFDIIRCKRFNSKKYDVEYSLNDMELVQFSTDDLKTACEVFQFGCQIVNGIRKNIEEIL